MIGYIKLAIYALFFVGLLMAENGIIETEYHSGNGLGKSLVLYPASYVLLCLFIVCDLWVRNSFYRYSALLLQGLFCLWTIRQYGRAQEILDNLVSYSKEGIEIVPPSPGDFAACWQVIGATVVCFGAVMMGEVLWRKYIRKI